MEKIEEMFQKIQDKLQGMDTKLEQITSELGAIKQENLQLKEQAVKQGKRIEFIEREIRKKNLVMQGVEEEVGEEESETTEKIITVLKKIGTEIDKDKDLEEAKRIGIYKAGGSRPIIIKLVKHSKKMEILKNAKNLKGSKIWINEDYPKEIQEERKQLIPRMKEARQKGCMAQIKYNKLVINNEIFGAEDRDNITQYLANTENEKNTNNKRSVSERSPEEDPRVTQLKKITKTSNTKN